MERRGFEKGSAAAPDPEPDRLLLGVDRGRDVPLQRNPGDTGRSEHSQSGAVTCRRWVALGRLSFGSLYEGQAIVACLPDDWGDS
ncbi:hypothetical protein D3C84_1203530 [compost metagenome]